MLSSADIVALHDQRTRLWHAAPDSADDAAGDWLAAVARQHRANFDLWHIEDEARAPGATDAELADVKRRIDLTNQLRNDLAEELDLLLLAWLADQAQSGPAQSGPAQPGSAQPGRVLPNPAAPLHSESPGLIVDRLSILALKIYHTREEAERADAPPGHAARNLDRLAILDAQRADLAACLDALWRETLAGTRRFKLYRQLKMYNDPSLNPAIYRRPAS